MVTHEEADFKVPHVELEGVDQLSASALRSFMTTWRLHRRLMARVFAERGTHPGQAVCLHVIAVHEPVAQRDLAQALHLSRPTVSKMLQTMEKAGLVERCADHEDRRLTRVSLTVAGRRVEREQRAVAGDVVNESIGMLPEADRRELARLLEALAARFEAAIEARSSGSDEAAG